MELQLYQSFPPELESEWNTLLAESINHVPFLRYEYLSRWWQTRGGGEWPEESRLVLVTAREGEKLVGIAPLFYVPEWQGKPSLMLVGSIEVSDYLDLIATPESLPAFVDALLPFLKSKETGLPQWERLDLYNLLDSSPTLQVLESLSKKYQWEYQAEQLQHSPYIPLPGNWDEYLASIDKKQRHEIRRKMRRAYGGAAEVRWYFVTQADTLDEEIEAFMGLMAQDADKERFLTPAMRDHMRLTIRCAFEEGCLNLAFLEVDGHKAAGYLSFDYLNRLWVYNSGIDWDFNDYSPGWVLLGELLQWANENQREAFDFMRGDEDYKYRFGGVDRFVLRAKLQPPQA